MRTSSLPSTLANPGFELTGGVPAELLEAAQQQAQAVGYAQGWAQGLREAAAGQAVHEAVEQSRKQQQRQRPDFTKLAGKLTHRGFWMAQARS